MTRVPMPRWAPLGALSVTLVLAWVNFLGTARWAAVPGALNGAKKPWYAAALIAATLLTLTTRREVGREIRIGRPVTWALLLASIAILLTALFSRLPLSMWSEIPFKDDYTPLYQSALNGVRLLQRGSVVWWNWWLMGGYPTSTDIAQSFGSLAFVPTVLFGPQIGYHVLHAIAFLAVPSFVWWDISQENAEEGALAAG